VRQRIGRALAGGQLLGPDAMITRWQLLASRPKIAGAADSARFFR